MPEFYAHTLEGEPVPKRWEVEDHLPGVAKRAGSSAREFVAGNVV